MSDAFLEVLLRGGGCIRGTADAEVTEAVRIEACWRVHCSVACYLWRGDTKILNVNGNLSLPQAFRLTLSLKHY